MKKYGTIILIFGIIFYLSYILFAQGQQMNRDNHLPVEQFDVPPIMSEPGNQNAMESKKMDFTNSEGSSEIIEEENYFADDQEIFARKLFQKKLPPLSQKEKIIWAFRLSKTTIFL